MNKVEGQPLPTWHGHVPTPQTANRNRRLWLIAALTGILIFATNFRSVLETASWKPHIVYRKGRLDTTPRSHYTLPSGDKIPSVALGEPAPLPYSTRVNLCLLIYATGVRLAGGEEVGQAVKAALAAGYRHIDGAWIYGVRTTTFLQGIREAKYMHTERTRGWRRDQGERGSTGGHLHHLEGM